MVTMPREQYEGIQIKRANIGLYLQVVEVDVVGNYDYSIGLGI